MKTQMTYNPRQRSAAHFMAAHPYLAAWALFLGVPLLVLVMLSAAITLVSLPLLLF